MKKSTITINPKTAWLMGVDPVGTSEHTGNLQVGEGEISSNTFPLSSTGLPVQL